MSERAKETLKKAQQVAKAKAQLYKTVFQSAHGRDVLGDLKEQFDPSILCKANADNTLVKAAQRDVIRFIEDMINNGVRNETEKEI